MDLEEHVLALEKTATDLRAQAIAMKFVLFTLIEAHPHQADLRRRFERVAASNVEHMRDRLFDLQYPPEAAQISIEAIQQHVREWLQAWQPPAEER